MGGFAVPIVSALASSLFSKMLAPKQEAAPAPVAPAAPPEAPKLQASQSAAPDAFATASNQNAMGQGPGATDLSGLGGVDQKSLNIAGLGSKTVLG
jgi:predicted flap endonuclease-1-like 5' DNA nuclease